MRIVDKPSPNSSPRNGAEPLATVIHYDASISGSGAIAWMRSPQSRVSAHFHIDRDGAVCQLVDLARSAWHAGIGALPLPGGTAVSVNCNEHSIGIEIANVGLLQRGDDGGLWYHDSGTSIRVTGDAMHAALVWPSGMRIEGWWAPFPLAQIDALKGLLDDLAGRGYGKAVANLVGHDEIAKPDGRKQDPGCTFPWEQFARACPRAITVERLP
jgi:N-acetylmuramoyl-L-alanine amidase